MDEIERFLSENEIIRSRGIGQGVLSAENAVRYSAAGPFCVHRASLTMYDGLNHILSMIVSTLMWQFGKMAIFMIG